ncbi:MAG: HEAT repeat domain-containing protein [Phycisphaerae bacterium]|jgi:HEAT repeat protein
MSRRLLTLTLLLAAATAGAQTSAPTTQAMDYLRGMLSNPSARLAALEAFQTTQDKDLLPIFVAVAQKGETPQRLQALGIMADLGGAAAVPVLQERLKNDPQSLAKAEALARLVVLKGVTAEQLTELLKSEDEVIRCIAARALIKQGLFTQASPALTALTGSSDLTTASLARMSLLGAGDKTRAAELDKTLADPNTPAFILSMLMEQIVEEKIAPAADLAKRLAENAPSVPVKIRACRALAAVSPSAAGVLLDAIQKNDQTVFRLQLLRTLADLSDGKAQLQTLAAGNDPVALLARFELARAAGGAEATVAANAAIAPGHRVVLEYFLDAAAKDIAASPAKAEFYVPALAELIRSTDPNATVIKFQHSYAVKAATLLADLGSEQALKVLAAFLTGPYNATQRSVAAAMAWSKNPAVCPMMRPLLASPYEDLSTDAALSLGRLGDAAAKPALEEILANPNRYSRQLSALAGWYLIKMSGQSPAAVKELADSIK